MVSIITGAIGLSAAAAILFLMRRDRLHAAHGTGWVVVAAGFALLGFAPGLIDGLAAYLNIDYPPVLAITIGITVIVIKLLLMDIERARIEVRNQRLTQRVAMLEAMIRKQARAQAPAADKAVDAVDTDAEPHRDGNAARE